MSPRPPKRLVVGLLAGVIAALLVVAGALLVLDADDTPDGVATTEGAAVASSTPSSASPSASASPTVSPSPSAAPMPTPTASPQGEAPLRDLAALVPERIAGFTRSASSPAGRLPAGPSAAEDRGVRYRNDEGDEVLHVVALYRSNAAAGAALRQWRDQALERRGARVVDDTGLEDTDGVRRGRLLQVRTRSGEIIVLWRNRNLVARLGPGRPRLQRRLYDAWPY